MGCVWVYAGGWVGGCMRECAGVHGCAKEGLGMCESVQGYMGVVEYGSGD